jgi:hypothetical protein
MPLLCPPIDQVVSKFLDKRVDVTRSSFPVNLELVDDPPNQPFVVINAVPQGFHQAHTGVVD